MASAFWPQRFDGLLDIRFVGMFGFAWHSGLISVDCPFDEVFVLHELFGLLLEHDFEVVEDVVDVVLICGKANEGQEDPSGLPEREFANGVVWMRTVIISVVFPVGVFGRGTFVWHDREPRFGLGVGYLAAWCSRSGTQVYRSDR